MARTPMVTRSMNGTQVTVLCLNIETSEPSNKTIVVPREYKDDKKLFKKVEEIINNDKEKAVHIVDKQTVSKLYGMSESEFIAHAKELDPTTRKEVEAKETTEE